MRENYAKIVIRREKMDMLYIGNAARWPI